MSSHSAAPVPADLNVAVSVAPDPVPVPAGPEVTVIVAPDRTTKPVGKSVFLAGSIDQGSAPDWQAETIKHLRNHKDITIYTPRRKDWDSSWRQDADYPPFREQVVWELDALDGADVIMMYLAPDTKAPISLLELGLYAATGRMIVGCPKGFYRRGNVQIVCEKHGIELVDTFEELLEATKGRLLKPAGGQ